MGQDARTLSTSLFYFILFSQHTFGIAGQDKHGSKVYSWSSVRYYSIVIIYYGANCINYCSFLSHPKPHVRATSKARMGPPNQNTTHLPSRSAVVPYSEGSPSSRQYASRVQPAHVLDRRLLAP